ncbi:MAG: class C sortase [Clostridiales Family XIII bacterium]|jgi:sortase A|nr:class C sortase [Clostridiales Family XIII bacterium]
MKGRTLPIIIVSILLLAGICVLAYPWFSNWYATRGDAKIIKRYDETVSALSEAQIKEEFDKAVRYNKRLDGALPLDPFSAEGPLPFDDYKDILDVNHDGVMGYLMIPKIKANFPVYHGVTDEVLSHGIGHIPTTALPVGGKGTHSVLAGHRGMPGYELFTKLDVLRAGDIFQINILGQTLSYCVDDVSVVLPDKTDFLAPAADKDYVSLVTCTPLGINSHRLIVRGVRCANPDPADTALKGNSGLSVWQKQTLIAGSITAAVMAGAIFIIIAVRRKRRKEEDGHDS